MDDRVLRKRQLWCYPDKSDFDCTLCQRMFNTPADIETGQRYSSWNISVGYNRVMTAIVPTVRHNNTLKYMVAERDAAIKQSNILQMIGLCLMLCLLTHSVSNCD